MPFNADDVRRVLEEAILQTKTADATVAPKIADALAPVLVPALNALAGEAPALMTAAEALFVRDTVASELEPVGGAQVAERLLVAGYIDVQPILAMHRRSPSSTPEDVGAATGAIPVPATPLAGHPVTTGGLPLPLSYPGIA